MLHEFLEILTVMNFRINKNNYYNKLDDLIKRYNTVTYLKTRRNYNYTTTIITNMLFQIRKHSELNIKLLILPNLKNMRSLDLSADGITKIENLESLTNLVELNLSYNNIEKIENLDRLINLLQLSLIGNKITKIENIHNLTKLRTVFIMFNNITNKNYSQDGLNIYIE